MEGGSSYRGEKHISIEERDKLRFFVARGKRRTVKKLYTM